MKSFAPQTNLHLGILNNLSPEGGLGAQWESLVEANTAGGAKQSLRWAEMMRSEGTDYVHFGIFETGRLIGGAIFYVSEAVDPYGSLVASEGPVLFWDDTIRTQESVRLLMDAAEHYATTNGIHAVEPIAAITH